MPSPLIWKVYTHDGQYMAAFAYAQDAAIYMGAAGPTVLKVDGRIVFRQGEPRPVDDPESTDWINPLDQVSATDSVDKVAALAWARRHVHTIQYWHRGGVERWPDWMGSWPRPWMWGRPGAGRDRMAHAWENREKILDRTPRPY
jgi:hypothetical protein